MASKSNFCTVNIYKLRPDTSQIGIVSNTTVRNRSDSGRTSDALVAGAANDLSLRA